MEVILDFETYFSTNATIFLSEHAKALERRINIIPCEYYVEKRTLQLISSRVRRKKSLLDVCVSTDCKADIEYLENSRVTEITHDWLNFGYEFVSSRSVSNANQKACINLLRKLIEIKSDHESKYPS